MRDLVPFAQFKKRKKHPWRSVTFRKVTAFSWVFFFSYCFYYRFLLMTLLLSNNPSLILPEIIRYQFYYDLRRVLKGNIVHKRNSFLRDIHFVLYSVCSKDDPWFVYLFFPKLPFVTLKTIQKPIDFPLSIERHWPCFYAIPTDKILLSRLEQLNHFILQKNPSS